MNTFYMYTMPLSQYSDLIKDKSISEDKKRVRLHKHLLLSGTNRRIITLILRENGLSEDDQMPQHGFDVHTFSMKYRQIESLVQEELCEAAGHFSHTLHRLNLAAFYYLSFDVEKELTVVLIRNELPGGVYDRNNWEGISPTMNRFYRPEFPENITWYELEKALHEDSEYEDEDSENQ